MQLIIPLLLDFMTVKDDFLGELITLRVTTINTTVDLPLNDIGFNTFVHATDDLEYTDLLLEPKNYTVPFVLFERFVEFTF